MCGRRLRVAAALAVARGGGNSAMRGRDTCEWPPAAATVLSRSRVARAIRTMGPTSPRRVTDATVLRAAPSVRAAASHAPANITTGDSLTSFPRSYMPRFHAGLGLRCRTPRTAARWGTGSGLAVAAPSLVRSRVTTARQEDHSARHSQGPRWRAGRPDHLARRGRVRVSPRAAGRKGRPGPLRRA